MEIIKKVLKITEIRNKQIFLIFLLPLALACFEGFGIGMIMEILKYVESSRLDKYYETNNTILLNFFDFFNLNYNLTSLSICAILPILTKFYIDYKRLIFFSKLEYGFQYNLRNYIIKNYTNSNWLFFVNNPRGVLTSSIGLEVREGSLLLRAGPDLLSNIFLGSIYFIILIYISFSLSILSLVIFSFSIIIFKLISRNLKFISKNASKTLRNLNLIFEEFLNSIKIIKTRGIENLYLKKIDDVNRNIMNAWISLQRKNHLIYSTTNPFLIVGVFLILYIGVENLNLKIAELGIFFLVLNKIANLVIRCNGNFVNITHSIEILKKIFELSNMSIKSKDYYTGTTKKNTFNKQIEFKNVSFSYSKKNLVLDKVNFNIKKGERTLILGKSGSGKSTLINLILRLQIENSGKILFDDLNINNIDINCYRNMFALVSQSPIFFFGTIRENLVYGLPSVSNEEINDSLKLADCYDFVNHLPEKIDTNLGEHGSRFSGGQKQRLSIARGLLQKPEILVLDEPTSSLDSESESQIISTLSKLQQKITIIVVSHSKRLLKDSNKIIFLNSNEELICGSHQKLINENKLYRNFIDNEGFN